MLSHTLRRVVVSPREYYCVDRACNAEIKDHRCMCVFADASLMINNVLYLMNAVRYSY